MADGPNAFQKSAQCLALPSPREQGSPQGESTRENVSKLKLRVLKVCANVCLPVEAGCTWGSHVCFRWCVCACMCACVIHKCILPGKGGGGKEQGPPAAGRGTAAPGLQGRWGGAAFQRRRILSLESGDLQRGAPSISPSTAGRPTSHHMPVLHVCSR